MGTSGRQVGAGSKMAQSLDMPGPGNYDGADQELRMKAGVSHKFDKSERKGVSDGNPGPG